MILDDEKYMNLALAEAQKAYELGEVPIGAVLVAKDGTTVSVGHNLRETAKDATAHAEIEAIRAANKKLDRWRLSGTTLYVTIEPCPMCAGAIVNSRIDRVVYGGADIKAGAVHSIFNVLTNSNLNHQTEVTAGVLEDRCCGIMRDFFKMRREQNKKNRPNNPQSCEKTEQDTCTLEKE